MRFILLLLAMSLAPASSLSAATAAPFPSLDLGAHVQPIPASASFGEPGFFVWCGAPIKGDDGKYHLLYSRWPVSVGFAPGWALHSEIAYAVADSPFGPFRHVNVALPARGVNPATGKKYWDGDVTHNPNLLRHPKGKYYLYYMGNYGDGKDYPTHRNHQRIGLAVADSPAGPWKRFDQPIVDVSPDPTAFDSLVVTNPAAAVRPDGGILLIYKAVTQEAGKRMGGKVRYGAALAATPEGPYLKTPGRIFEADEPAASKHWMLAEDPFIWFSKTHGNRYYAVARDVVGHFTGEGGGIALFQSADGLNWRAAEHPKVIGKSYAHADGTRSITKLERPALLIEDGEPVALFGAADGYLVKGRISTNVAIPLTPPTTPAMSSPASPALSSTAVPDASKWLQPLRESSIFSDPLYNIWCGSMVTGDDGKYHLFYSRWLRSDGHLAWVTHSEIARAVSDSPYGPFKHAEIVLPERDVKYWDGKCTHNPTVVRIGKKFYLYYMGNTGDRAKTNGLNWQHRNNQRVGVAVADSPSGPWTRFDQPLIDVSSDPSAPDSLVVTNPSVTVRPDGGVLMIYKAVGRKSPLPFGGPVVHLTATADNPLGPFTKQLQPVLTDPGTSFPAEDPFIWHDGTRYLAIVKDMGGHFTKVNPSLALFASDDGLTNWKPAPQPLVSGLSLTRPDGSKWALKKLERPQLWFRDGKPAILFCAAADKPDLDGSVNVAIPLDPVAPPPSSAAPAAPTAPASTVPDASKWLQPLQDSSIFGDPVYNVWCGSMVTGDDGKYHLFYSRWPRALGHNAWVTHSEIARAVSDSPYGPYKHADIVLPERDVKYWDGKCTHNPTVLRIGKKYYLYYMANTGDRAKAQWLNWQHRNSQRIGVAVADSPSGPWTRFDQPLIDVSADPSAPDSLAVNNPSVAIRPDGGVLMLYKAIGRQKPLPFGGPVVHLTATADNPLGPFTKQLQPVLTDPATSFPAEDPFIWHDGTRYLAIVKDMGGYFTKVNPSLALFYSPDGLTDWKPAPQPLVSGLSLTRPDGSKWSLKKLERPQLWFRDGKPAILFCAAADKPDLDGSVNVAIPLKVEAP